jgi:quercetin dioxygenase-like cupin family protein
MSFDIKKTIIHHFSDNVYARQMSLPKGYKVDTHKHNYDHLSILSNGTALVITDGEPTTYTAPACINIEKDKVHEIYALEDMTWFCIHSTEEKDTSKIDKVLIKEN